MHSDLKCVPWWKNFAEIIPCLESFKFVVNLLIEKLLKFYWKLIFQLTYWKIAEIEPKFLWTSVETFQKLFLKFLWNFTKILLKINFSTKIAEIKLNFFLKCCSKTRINFNKIFPSEILKLIILPNDLNINKSIVNLSRFRLFIMLYMLVLMWNIKCHKKKSSDVYIGKIYKNYIRL